MSLVNHFGSFYKKESKLICVYLDECRKQNLLLLNKGLVISVIRKLAHSCR